MLATREVYELSRKGFTLLQIKRLIAQRRRYRTRDGHCQEVVGAEAFRHLQFMRYLRERRGLWEGGPSDGARC